MANVKITELTNLTDPSTTDVMPVVDVDADVTKKVSVGEVVGKITGDVDVATDGTATISELPVSKLQDGAARQLLQTAANGTDVEWTDDVDLPGTLGVTGQSTLASAAVSDLTEDRVVIAGASGELEDSANLTFDGSELGVTGTLDVSSDATIGGDLTVVGDLTVEGTTTTLETQTVTVEDKNIELGVVDTPSDATADGGGLTLKGATDKTINWVDATDAWTFSEHVDIASTKEFRINGTKVLDATSLGSAVVSSSLTSVGTIATGTWEGDAIDAAYLDATVVTTSNTGTVTSTMILDGTIVDDDINASAAIADTKLDTISTAGKVSNSATTATDANTASAIVARDASGDFTAGTITADLIGNADTATALETARDIGGVSFDGTANINLPGVNTTGNQDTSGNAATATKLDSSRTFEVTGDVTGTVNSDLTSGASIATSIASGVIVNADVNASAAIAGTKIDPDFGSQTVQTTGVINAGSGTAAAPAVTVGTADNGLYSPGADQVAISTNGAQALYIDSDGDILVADGNRMEIDEIRARDGAGLKLFDDGGAGIFIEDGGKVGLGNSDPLVPLDVHTTTQFDTTEGRSTNTLNLVLASGGTIGDGEYSAGVTFSKINSSRPGAAINAVQTTADADTLGLSFLTHQASGTSNELVEQVRITHDGKLLVGTIASPAYQLQVSTDSAGKPSTNTWTIVSDERIKEDIELADLDICYDVIKNIPLKRFKWKDEVYTEEQVPDRRKLGWIAQDVESIFPKAVRIHEFKYNQVFEETVIPAVEEELDEDGNIITPAQPERIEKGELISEDVIEDCRDLNADQLYAAMYGAIQKLIAKVEILEAKVAALEA